MAWTLKPVLPEDAAFDNEIVYTTTSLEISDVFKKHVQSVVTSTNVLYINKYTGFETNKYKIDDADVFEIDIMMSGSMPRWLFSALKTLAEAINGPGMILQFNDDWVNGTELTPIVYKCRWVNAGDFVENNVLLCGASIKLLAFDVSEEVEILEYQKVINTPGSGLEWDLQIDAATATQEIQRVP